MTDGFEEDLKTIIELLKEISNKLDKPASNIINEYGIDNTYRPPYVGVPYHLGGSPLGVCTNYMSKPIQDPNIANTPFIYCSQDTLNEDR